MKKIYLKACGLTYPLTKCRGSLAWLGRQTHNLEIQGLKRSIPEVAGSNPVPGTNLLTQIFASFS